MEIVWEDKMKATNTNACRRFTNFQECMLALPELQLVSHLIILILYYIIVMIGFD